MKPTVQAKTAEVKKPANRYALPEKTTTRLFDRENYKWMLAALVVVAIGFILMAGGKSSAPNVFQDEKVYGFTRITVAPILIIAGFVIGIFAIMRKPGSAE